MMVLVALLGSLLHDTQSLTAAHASRQGEMFPQDAALRSAFEWLRTETNPESVVMCVNIPQWYLFTGRRGVPPPSVPTPDAVFGTLIHYDVRYVISAPTPGYQVKDLNMLLIEPMVSAYGDIFTPVYRAPQHPGVIIYAVSRAAANRMAAISSYATPR